MIKLLGLLFTFMTLYGGETVFILPNHHTLFVHQLNTIFKGASQIRIVTPSFNHSELQKGILKSAKKGSTVTLIVHDPHGDPLSMVQYERINLFTTSISLTESLILIDDTRACTLDGALNAEEFASIHSRIRCSDNQDKIKAIHSSLRFITDHSNRYLE